MCRFAEQNKVLRHWNFENIVSTKGHEDLRNTLFISAKVDPVTNHNKNALNRLSGKLHACKATHF